MLHSVVHYWEVAKVLHNNSLSKFQSGNVKCYLHIVTLKRVISLFPLIDSNPNCGKPLFLCVQAPNTMWNIVYKAHLNTFRLLCNGLCTNDILGSRNAAQVSHHVLLQHMVALSFCPGQDMQQLTMQQVEWGEEMVEMMHSMWWERGVKDVE